LAVMLGTTLITPPFQAEADLDGMVAVVAVPVVLAVAAARDGYLPQTPSRLGILVIPLMQRDTY